MSATETGRIRYSAAVIRGNLRLLAGMVRTNRPWRLMSHMSKALAFVAGTAAVTIANSSMWQISDALGWPRRILLMIAAITALVTWLIVAMTCGSVRRTPAGANRRCCSTRRP